MAKKRSRTGSDCGDGSSRRRSPSAREIEAMVKRHQQSNNPMAGRTSLACPFFKLCPESYAYVHDRDVICNIDYGFQTIGRVKEHIWRQHTPLDDKLCHRALDDLVKAVESDRARGKVNKKDADTSKSRLKKIRDEMTRQNEKARNGLEKKDSDIQAVLRGVPRMTPDQYKRFCMLDLRSGRKNSARDPEKEAKQTWRKVFELFGEWPEDAGHDFHHHETSFHWSAEMLKQVFDSYHASMRRRRSASPESYSSSSNNNTGDEHTPPDYNASGDSDSTGGDGFSSDGGSSPESLQCPDGSVGSGAGAGNLDLKWFVHDQDQTVATRIAETSNATEDTLCDSTFGDGGDMMFGWGEYGGAGKHCESTDPSWAPYPAEWWPVDRAPEEDFLNYLDNPAYAS